jgi:hypothetical protein
MVTMVSCAILLKNHVIVLKLSLSNLVTARSSPSGLNGGVSILVQAVRQDIHPKDVQFFRIHSKRAAMNSKSLSVTAAMPQKNLPVANRSPKCW